MFSLVRAHIALYSSTLALPRMLCRAFVFDARLPAAWASVMKVQHVARQHTTRVNSYTLLSCLPLLLPFKQNTGVITVQRGFPIIRDIKGHHGTFRGDGVGDIKWWIINCENDNEARHVAKFLKKKARKSGHKAYVSFRLLWFQ